MLPGHGDERFAIAEAALARRHQEGRAADPEVAFAWGQMVASRGCLRVEQLAAETGWSCKRLWSRFWSQIGLTLKRAAQLIRFDHAAHRLAAGHSAALVAAESGYTDQSHLHRDVKTEAGLMKPSREPVGAGFLGHCESARHDDTGAIRSRIVPGGALGVAAGEPGLLSFHRYLRGWGACWRGGAGQMMSRLSVVAAASRARTMARPTRTPDAGSTVKLSSPAAWTEPRCLASRPGWQAARTG